QVRPPNGDLSGLRKESQSGARPAALDAPLSPPGSFAGGASGPGHPPLGPQAPALRLPADPCPVGAGRLAGEPETHPPAVDRAPAPTAGAAAEGQEAGAQTR